MEGVHVLPGDMSHERDMFLGIYAYKGDILRIEISYIAYRNILYPIEIYGPYDSSLTLAHYYSKLVHN